MNPITHFLAGWAVAESARLEYRDRALVTLAGVAPDVDGLGVVVDLYHMAAGTGPSYYFQDYHHLFHCLGGALTTTVLFAGLARQRLRTAALVFLSFHVHLLCDLLGSRGPDGYQWPLPYLQPFSDAAQLSWSGQWPLNSWQNAVITLALIAAMMVLARRRGYSALELVSTRADRELVQALRQRWPLESTPGLCHDGALDEPETKEPS